LLPNLILLFERLQSGTGKSGSGGERESGCKRECVAVRRRESGQLGERERKEGETDVREGGGRERGKKI